MMTNLTHTPDLKLIEAPLYEVPISTCKAFIASLKKKGISASSLEIFKSTSVADKIDDEASVLIENLYQSALSVLKDHSCGIVAIDIPQFISDDPTQDTLLGAIIAQAITSKFMLPAIDRKNQTPFTLYNASTESEKKLKEAGLKFYSPEEKLGFHTDGRIDRSEVYIPELLSIYNLFIAYRETGSFYWLPFELWNDFEQLAEMAGWNTPYKFELTPIVYPGKNGDLESSSPKTVEAPIFWRNDSIKSMFFNGEVVERADNSHSPIQGMIEELKSSMLRNPIRFHVPQRPRRLMIMHNASGAHSRDIFNNPIPGTRYTRSFMRSVSMEGKHVGRVG